MLMRMRDMTIVVAAMLMSVDAMRERCRLMPLSMPLII